MRIKERFNKKLLVEGNDDQHVIWSLCEKFQIPQNFDVIDSEGIDNLQSQISVRLKQSDVVAIGIIIDADTDLMTRWNSLADLLGNLGFTLPAYIPNTGLIIELNGIKIGVWIMPNNILNGMLEDFVSFLVPKNDQLITEANNTLENIEIKNLNKYSPIHKSKALIHTWLAWQEDPGTQMGLAITKRYLTTDEQNCLQLVNWIQNTFI
jgi:hypothetical protein